MLKHAHICYGLLSFVSISVKL